MTELMNEPCPVTLIVRYRLERFDHKAGKQVWAVATNGSKRDSSVVYIDTLKRYAQIQNIYEHKSNFIVAVRLYANYVTDPETGLHFTIPACPSDTWKMMFLDKISEPLVTAKDDNKLWILNGPMESDPFSWYSGHCL